MTHTVILAGDAQRTRAKQLVDKAPAGFVVTIREPRRTGEQNDLMWALLSDVSRAMPEGRRHTPDVWKALFMHALGYEQQFQMGLDGNPFSLGFRSSKLTRRQMSDLIELVYSYGAQHGVRWSEPQT
jgi:hypothetical protein